MADLSERVIKFVTGTDGKILSFNDSRKVTIRKGEDFVDVLLQDSVLVQRRTSSDLMFLYAFVIVTKGHLYEGHTVYISEQQICWNLPRWGYLRPVDVLGITDDMHYQWTEYFRRLEETE